MSAEKYDEKKFCRYYLQTYTRLKDLDRSKQSGIKFSKAFAEFTVLVYHNVFGGSPIAARASFGEIRKSQSLNNDKKVRGNVAKIAKNEVKKVSPRHSSSLPTA